MLQTNVGTLTETWHFCPIGQSMTVVAVTLLRIIEVLITPKFEKIKGAVGKTSFQKIKINWKWRFEIKSMDVKVPPLLHCDVLRALRNLAIRQTDV